MDEDETDGKSHHGGESDEMQDKDEPVGKVAASDRDDEKREPEKEQDDRTNQREENDNPGNIAGEEGCDQKKADENREEAGEEKREEGEENEEEKDGDAQENATKVDEKMTTEEENKEINVENEEKGTEGGEEGSEIGSMGEAEIKDKAEQGNQTKITSEEERKNEQQEKQGRDVETEAKQKEGKNADGDRRCEGKEFGDFVDFWSENDEEEEEEEVFSKSTPWESFKGKVSSIYLKKRPFKERGSSGENRESVSKNLRTYESEGEGH